MKKSYFFLPALAVASVGFLAFQNSADDSVIESYTNSHRFSGGGMAERTGAPGETNCTACHAGSTQNGDTENQVSFLDGTTPVTSYVPGSTYVVSLQMASNPAKKGFSAVALDLTEANAGSFTGNGLGGTQDYTQNNRHYVSQTSSSNTDAVTLWAWQWTAPATNVGDVVFYVASNAADNDGSTSGDVVYLSQHIINASSASVTELANEESNFQAGYNVVNHKVEVDFTYLSSGDMHMNLVDMSGRSVYNYSMGNSEIGENHESIALPDDLKNGMYVVHFFVGNKAMSAKIMVKR